MGGRVKRVGSREVGRKECKTRIGVDARYHQARVNGNRHGVARRR
jgi:hypothetical protein